VKQIQLTQGRVAIVDDQDYERVAAFRWCAKHDKHTWYAIRCGTGNTTVWLHRFILNATKGVQVDHANGNGLDNRRGNLRICSHTDNARNRQKQTGTSSRFKGVSWRKARSKWVARIEVNQRSLHLGYFASEELAAASYNAAAAMYFGEFARLNEVSL